MEYDHLPRATSTVLPDCDGQHLQTGCAGSQAIERVCPLVRYTRQVSDQRKKRAYNYICPDCGAPCLHKTQRCSAERAERKQQMIKAWRRIGTRANAIPSSNSSPGES